MSRTKFAITVSINAASDLTGAQKREIKEALKEKALKLKVRGFELVFGSVKIVDPVVSALPVTTRKTRTPRAEAGAAEPVRKTRAPRAAVSDEVVTRAPRSASKAAPVVEEPVRKTRGAKAEAAPASPAKPARKPRAVAASDLDIVDEPVSKKTKLSAALAAKPAAAKVAAKPAARPAAVVGKAAAKPAGRSVKADADLVD